MKTMKAIVQEKYGDASQLRVSQVTIPQPKAGEVLVKVKATSLNAPDWRLLRGTSFLVRLISGLFKPKHVIKGTDFSGVVVTLGAGPSRFNLGDEVYGDLSNSGFGAFADFVCVKEEMVAYKPRNLSHLEAAALPLTAVTALQGVRNVGAVKRGDRVLIVGASGGVGSYAVQLARHFAASVTGVTGAKHGEKAKALGAEVVIDYGVTPLETLTDQFDVVIAINGYNPLSTYRRLMGPQGRFVMVGGKSMKQILQVTAFGGMLSKKGGQTLKGLMAKPGATDLGWIAELVEAGGLVPVIEKEVAFDEIPMALAELEKGHTGGKIVAWVNSD